MGEWRAYEYIFVHGLCIPCYSVAIRNICPLRYLKIKILVTHYNKNAQQKYLISLIKRQFLSHLCILFLLKRRLYLTKKFPRKMLTMTHFQRNRLIERTVWCTDQRLPFYMQLLCMIVMMA